MRARAIFARFIVGYERRAKAQNHHSVLYQRLPRLFDTLALARGDGHHTRLLKSLARVELLILDQASPLGDIHSPALEF